MNTDEWLAIEQAIGQTIRRQRPLAGGYSHETCLVETDDGLAVARLGGPDPAIEAAVMTTARQRVPVPEVWAIATAPAYADARPFMVIDHIAGTPLDEVLSAGRLDDSDAGELGREVGRVGAQIGAITLDRPGFFSDAELSVDPERSWSEQLADVARDCMDRTPTARLDLEMADAWKYLCTEYAPLLTDIDAHAYLVHSDFNPKNLLVSPVATGWRVDAVLDWEFSYAGCPLADTGNMARHADEYPDGFLQGFRAGYAEHRPPEGPPLLDDWVVIGHVLDMFALSELVTRPVGHPIADKAAEQIRRRVRHGIPDGGYRLR